MKQAISSNLNCVYNTLNFIEKHYDQLISIEQLEDISHYSYRNIQRIFRYTCGETIGAYQKRLRVENAYKMLLYSDHSISVIALKVGFSNVASFSKAFKQHFLISPTEARAGKTPLFTKADILPVEATPILKPEIIYVRPTLVYYKSSFINYIDTEIESQWDTFLQYEFPQQGNEFYGVVADEPLIRENLNCRYDTCSSLQSLTSRLPSKTIGGGKYAQFTHHGRYDTIEDTYSQIYSGWILTAGLQFAPTPVIEKYAKHPDNTDSEEDQMTYIWLPLD
ncbi:MULTISPECIES: GyrI-like domain-containing protein [unclassified Sphingobacterium]|uniref:AraC family transcriptional regulator n=1 Tax=unclassified Sphingobacterium TaxID=2609468 RepID=UPI0025E1585A|nr:MULTISPECIES: AraC family transcriptional regulator [unclassified Sphingobacterium]